MKQPNKTKKYPTYEARIELLNPKGKVIATYSRMIDGQTLAKSQAPELYFGFLNNIQARSFAEAVVKDVDG